MFGKIKKVFFTGVFGILYISFIAQLVYVLGWAGNVKDTFFGLALLSKRSSNSAQHNGFRRR